MEIYYNGNEFFRIIENDGHRIIAEDIFNEDVHIFEREGDKYINPYYELGIAKEVDTEESEWGELCVKIECTQCHGKTTVEALSCGMPASNCCGGCIEAVECSECEGRGYNLRELEEAWD